MFTNAKSVKLNGKEVKSIVLEDGGVLYEANNMSLTLSYSPATVYYGDTVTFTVTLTGRDVANKTIDLYASDNCFDYNTDEISVTTDSNGVASTNITCNTLDDLYIIATYNNLQEGIKLTINDKWNLDLVSDKDVLSYNDNDTATLTATLTKNNTGLADETISFTNTHNKLMSFDTQYAILGDKWELDAAHVCDIDGYVNTERTTMLIYNSLIKILQPFKGKESLFETSIMPKSIISYDNGILYYYDTNGIKQSYDINMVNGAYTNISNENHTIKSNILSLITDSNGQCNINYDSQGVGDITFTASCPERMLVSKPYSIEDCIIYDSLTSASGKWTVPSGVTSNYSSDGWRISANDYNQIKQIKLTEKLTNACSVEFTLMDYGTPNVNDAPVIIYQYTNGETTPNQEILMNTSSSSFRAVGTTINHAMVQGAVYRIEYTSSTIKVYEDDTLLASANNSVGLPTRFEWHMGANGRYVIYKDLKVKPL